MPMAFFDDTLNTPEGDQCGHEIEMWDGPGICTRHRDHVLTPTKENPSAQLHQENFEGWVWTHSGRVS